MNEIYLVQEFDNDAKMWRGIITYPMLVGASEFCKAMLPQSPGAIPFRLRVLDYRICELLCNFEEDPRVRVVLCHETHPISESI